MTPIIALGEIAAINPDTSIPIGANDLCSFVPMDAVDEVAAEIKKLSARPYNEVARGYTSFAENDVLLAKITPCMENGKCAIARGLRNGVGFGSTEFHVIRGSAKILPEWIYYYWRLPTTRALAERNMTGTAGQKRVPTSFLETLPIPVPQVDDQCNLTRLLQHADQLCRMRRYALRQCEDLRRSMYVQFCKQTHSNKWTRHEFGDTEVLEIVDGDRGSAYPKKTDFKGQGFCLFLNTGNVLKGEFDFAKCDFVTNKKDSELRKGKLRRNDIVLTTRGTLGNSALYDAHIKFDQIRINSGMVILRANTDVVLPEYLLAIINSGDFEKQVLSLTSGSAQQQLPIFVLNTITLDLPPLTMQQQFVNLVARHTRLYATHVEACRQADHLFLTLLHQAFSNQQ